MADWPQSPKHQRNIARLEKYLCTTIEPGTSAVIEAAKTQLDEYFAGTRSDFSIPLRLCGTDFQIMVYNMLMRIAHSQTVTYRELAQMAGCPSSVRAVANACGSNMLSIIIPCHRIIGTDGTLTGYAGTLPVKRFLLQLESSFTQN